MNRLLEVFKNFSKEKENWWLWLILSTLLLFWFFYFMEWFPWWLDASPDRGKFGDSFGSLNVLFSGLAFLGVIWAILLQKRELELQRTSLELQQQTLELQKEELQKQRETLQKQNFESSFFELLGLHSEIINSMEFDRIINHTASTYSGRKCFAHMLSELKKRVSYKKFFAEYQFHVDHYFRHLFNVIKFVDENEFLRKEKKQHYTNLIRAQLSTDELGVLFYHGLNKQGEKFKDLIEKYALFEGMDSVLQNRRRGGYKTSAYGKSD